MPDELVVVQTFQNELEAQMARGRLESAGIESMVSSDDCAGMQPQFQCIYGVKLLVFDYDLGKAREILEIDNSGPIEMPIDGTLDLHTFDPKEIGTLVPDYISACREAGILQVRIVHGKGTGTLRRTVHAILDRLPEVVSYTLGGDSGGSWGATIAILKPIESKLDNSEDGKP